jgi:hypothetical protein
MGQRRSNQVSSAPESRGSRWFAKRRAAGLSNVESAQNAFAITSEARIFPALATGQVTFVGHPLTALTRRMPMSGCIVQRRRLVDPDLAVPGDIDAAPVWVRRFDADVGVGVLVQSHHPGCK